MYPEAYEAHSEFNIIKTADPTAEKKQKAKVIEKRRSKKNLLTKRNGNNTKNIDFATCFLRYSHSEVKICDFTSYFLTILKLYNQAVCTNHSYVVNQHLRTDKICFIIRMTRTNKMHYFLLIYFSSKPLNVSSRFAAHDE